MDIKLEERKITIAHRLLHKRLRRGFGYDDRGLSQSQGFPD